MDLNKALKDFFIREPFYGTLMLNFNKKLVDDDHPVKTAAVAVEGLSLTLYINKSFWTCCNLENFVLQFFLYNKCL